MSASGRVSPEVLKRSFAEEKYLGLPPVLADAMVEAKAHLQDRRIRSLPILYSTERILPRSARRQKNLGSAFLKGYAQMLIDAANLRSAVRTMRMNKDTEFLKTALIPGGGIDTGRVLAAFGSGDTLASIYANTLLENAAALGAAAVKGGTMTEFELACDNAVTAYLTVQGSSPTAKRRAIAYLAAVEGETTALRMILTGMLAGLPTETIRERLRDLYA